MIVPLVQFPSWAATIHGEIETQAVEHMMAWDKPRKYPRFEAESPVRLSVNGSDRKYDGVCTAVAIGGMGVQVAAKFEIGEVVEIEFIGTPQPSLQAHIVYRNGYEYGLSFENIV